MSNEFATNTQMAMNAEETAADYEETAEIQVQTAFEKEVRNAEVFQTLCGIGFFTTIGVFVGQSWPYFVQCLNTYNRFNISFAAVILLKFLRFLYALFAMCCYKHSCWMCRNQCLNLYGPTVLGFSIAGLIWVYQDPVYNYQLGLANAKTAVSSVGALTSIFGGLRLLESQNRQLQDKACSSGYYQVITARYGNLESNTVTDNKQGIVDIYNGGRSEIWASNNEFGGDPAPGQSKQMQLSWTTPAGVNETRTVNEGETVTWDSGYCAKVWVWTAPKTNINVWSGSGIGLGSIIAGVAVTPEIVKKVDFIFKFAMWWTCAEWAIMCFCCLVVCSCVICGFMCCSKEFIHMSKVRMARSVPLAELYTGTKDADPNNPDLVTENNDVEMMQKENVM